MTGLRVGSSGVWIPTATRHFAPNRQEHTWGSSSLFFNEDRGTFPAVKRPISGFDLSPPAEVETEWSYACVVPLPPNLPSWRGKARLNCYPFFLGGGYSTSYLFSVLFHVHFQFNVVGICNNYTDSWLHSYNESQRAAVFLRFIW